jgi:CMP-N,N'-diacetyllegionaminic acid synthase
MAILGIIPARGGSKRIPGKNKKGFCGKPLISYIIESARGSMLLDSIVVNSDDDDILNIAAQFPNVIALKRPKKIAQDHSKAIEYVHQTLEYLEERGQSFDTVVILQPTSPLTLPEDIDNTIQLLRDSEADSSVSVMKLDHATHPVKMKVMVGDRLDPYLEEEKGRMAEHELPTIYVRNCSVYATRMKIIKAGKIIGSDCRGYIMPMERSIDINDPIDFEFAEFLYKKFQDHITK